jgi:hypothetical protein
MTSSRLPGDFMHADFPPAQNTGGLACWPHLLSEAAKTWRSAGAACLGRVLWGLSLAWRSAPPRFA